MQALQGWRSLVKRARLRTLCLRAARVQISLPANPIYGDKAGPGNPQERRFARQSDPNTTMTHIATRKEELYKEIDSTFGLSEAVGLKAKSTRILNETRFSTKTSHR